MNTLGRIKRRRTLARSRGAHFLLGHLATGKRFTAAPPAPIFPTANQINVWDRIVEPWRQLNTPDKTFVNWLTKNPFPSFDKWSSFVDSLKPDTYQSESVIGSITHSLNRRILVDQVTLQTPRPDLPHVTLPIYLVDPIGSFALPDNVRAARRASFNTFILSPLRGTPLGAHFNGQTWQANPVPAKPSGGQPLPPVLSFLNHE